MILLMFNVHDIVHVHCLWYCYVMPFFLFFLLFLCVFLLFFKYSYLQSLYNLCTISFRSGDSEMPLTELDEETPCLAAVISSGSAAVASCQLLLTAVVLQLFLLRAYVLPVRLVLSRWRKVYNYLQKLLCSIKLRSCGQLSAAPNSCYYAAVSAPCLCTASAPCP